MFTVLFERLACRIVLEKPLGQLELLEPNRLISLVVSIRSILILHFLFLCVLCYSLDYEQIVKPIHLMN